MGNTEIIFFREKRRSFAAAKKLYRRCRKRFAKRTRRIGLCQEGTNRLSILDKQLFVINTATVKTCRCVIHVEYAVMEPYLVRPNFIAVSCQLCRTFFWGFLDEGIVPTCSRTSSLARAGKRWDCTTYNAA